MRKFVVALVAFLAILGGGAFSPAPASASWNACEWGRFCSWDNENYWGEFNQVLYPTGQCLNTSMSNRISSVRNNRPLATVMYEGPGCTRAAWVVSSGQSYSPMPSGWNNQVQSIFLRE